MKESTSVSYKNIFKSTFLFAFVQLFNILAKVGLNKSAAVFLGSEGVGVISIYQSLVDMLKTFMGFGIPQSAVRDIAKMSAENNQEQISKTIIATKRVVYLTALLGAFITIVFSSYLSEWSFGNNEYKIEICILSIVILLMIITEGQLSILKGMRQLRSLAKASIFGSVAGLLSGIPLYFFFGYDGIVPTLIVVAITAVLFSSLYSDRVQCIRVDLSFESFVSEISSMVKMGMALMYVSFLGLLYNYLIKIYIVNTSGLEMVGFFQAGATIVTSYLGIITTAMATDYYPRISAIHDDNKKLTEEVNKQSTIGLLLIAPLIVVLILFLPFIITLLYSSDFLSSMDYIIFAVFGTVIMICSNAIGMILLAKQNTKIFFFSVTFSRVLGIIVTIISYNLYGLKGLGVSVTIIAILHMLLMQTIMYQLYKIKFNLTTIKLLLINLIFIFVAFVLSEFDHLYIKYSLGGGLIIISSIFSVYNLQTLMGINIRNIIKKKLFKR
ncbi:oligosaccharide flippase family protein [Photobacterium leiognathi subsp. mandapamensis]|uniref:oligosaccharide flippase family protein n=1 Tax=Photobacterium leiognathi TaxID=553611 RepID=UPI003AF38D62